MRWLKREMWKAGIALAGMLLLLVLMVLVPVSAAGAYEVASGLATPGTAQATPTTDATVTALNKEKLEQEVQQLKNQNGPDLLGLLRTNAPILFSTLAVVFGGLFGLWRWRVDRKDTQKRELEARQEAQDKELEDRKAERERRAEERFQAALTGLGGENDEAKIGAAILLRTFLRPGYEQFYIQTFDLAVVHLRLIKPPPPRSTDPVLVGLIPPPPLALTTLRQALSVVFKEAFPLARDRLNEQDPKARFHPESLDASYILLDNAYLARTDLKQVWMPQASLRNVDLREANLSEANLSGANLSDGTNLNQAVLMETNLSDANLSGADLGVADLSGANFSRANLTKADLYHATLSRANLTKAGLYHATLSRADLTGADLSGADLGVADLSGAIGTTPEQLKKAKSLKGAIMPDGKMYHDSSGAILPGADLREVDLSDVDLSTAYLSRANLSGCDLSTANLSEADLSSANLTGAKVTQEQLVKTKSLQGTTMPDGSIHL